LTTGVIPKATGAGTIGDSSVTDNGTTVSTTENLALATGKVLSWNGDTGLLRDSAGVVDVGNGTAGNKSGTLNFAQANIASYSITLGTTNTFGVYINSATDAGCYTPQGSNLFSVGYATNGGAACTPVIEWNASGNAAMGTIASPSGTFSSGNFAVGIANETGTGTTVGALAKLTGAPSTAIITGTGDTSGVIGIVVSGAGKSGNAIIAVSGIASCIFDAGGVTAGDYVIISTTTAGDCADGGATVLAGESVGRALATVASGTANVLINIQKN
jgi:hypothetical protein